MRVNDFLNEDADQRKQNALWAQITAHEKAAKQTKDLKRDHHLKMADQLRSQLKTSDNVAEGEVVAFPKKHRGDLDSVVECPKCGGDLQGGKYMGHAVKVCMPCKQVYLPPNSGIDQQGNPIKEAGVAEAEQQKGADYRDPPEADYGDDYQAMVSRVKKLAGLGPLKTVHDPAKRVYKNVPTATQPGDKK